jgi:flagellum-specific peptidoglycan hydrolase FlgJ
MKRIFEQNEDLSLTDITYKVMLYKILLIAVFIFSIFSSFKTEIKTEFINRIITVNDTVYVSEEFNDIELNEESILAELIKQGCVLPNIALAQFKIESTHFKSAICKENKNLAGIRTSNSEFVKKDTNGKAVKNRGHNVFTSYKNCIKEYIRIQNRYLKNINGKYAEDPEYISKLKTMK